MDGIVTCKSIGPFFDHSPKLIFFLDEGQQLVSQSNSFLNIFLSRSFKFVEVGIINKFCLVILC